MSQEKFEKTLSLLKGSLDYESFRDVDLVIEVIMSLSKLKLFFLYSKLSELISYHVFLVA